MKEWYALQFMDLASEVMEFEGNDILLGSTYIEKSLECYVLKQEVEIRFAEVLTTSTS